MGKKRLVINDSYPVELYGVAPQTQVVSYAPFWASVERYASDGVQEHLTVVFDEAVAVNSVMFKMSDKPVEVNLYYSTDVADVESATWQQWNLSTGEVAQFTINQWGGSESTGFVQVAFELQLQTVTMIRLTFDRLEVPFNGYVAASEQYVPYQSEFPYSIEVKDFSVKHVIKSIDDYASSKFLDDFGNLVETSLVTYEAANVLDGALDTFWVSQPNVVPDAVECLYLDIRQGGEAQEFNVIEVTPLYGGCQMNVYVSTDDDNTYEEKTWVPVPGTFTLKPGRILLPLQLAKYVKLEFTNLLPVPYHVVDSGIEVETRRFPTALKQMFKRRSENPKTDSEVGFLLMPNVQGDSIKPNEVIGVPDPQEEIAQAIERSSRILDTGIPDDFPTLWDARSYRYDLRTTIQRRTDDLFGDNGIVVEYFHDEVLPRRSVVSTFDLKRYKFVEEGQHEYAVERIPRSHKMAYMVGIRDLALYRTKTNVLFGEGEDAVWIETFPAAHYADTNTWDDGEGRIVIDESSIGSLPVQYVSQPFYTMRGFQFLELQTHERRPVEKFENRSFTQTFIGSVTDENITLSGTTPTALAHDQIVYGSVVIDGATEDTDYVVDYANGTIARTAGSGLPDPATVEVSYDYYRDDEDITQWVPIDDSTDDSLTDVSCGSERVTLKWNTLVFVGNNVLEVNRDGAGTAGGVMSQLVGVQYGGYTTAACSIYVPDEVLGDWYIEVFDSNGDTVMRKDIFPERGKWVTAYLTFETQTAASWWDTDYSYRRRVSITADSMALGVGESVRIDYDTSTDVTAGKMLANRDDLRVVFYDGVTNQEIPRVYTGPTSAAGSDSEGADEIWTVVQEPIAHLETDNRYFIYYGYAGAGSPSDSKSDVFTELSPTVLGAETYSAGGGVDGISGLDVYRDEPTKSQGAVYSHGVAVPDAGSVAVHYTPQWGSATASVTDEAITLDDVNGEQVPYRLEHSFVDTLGTGDPVVRSATGGGGTLYTDGVDYIWDAADNSITRIDGGGINDGDTVYVSYTYLSDYRIDGEPAKRSLIDMQDSSQKRLELYIYQSKLVLQVTDPPETVDDEESVFSSTLQASFGPADFVEGHEYLIYGEWGARPSDSNRERPMSLYVADVSAAGPWTLVLQAETDMVYDEVTYDNGAY